MIETNIGDVKHVVLNKHEKDSRKMSVSEKILHFLKMKVQGNTLNDFPCFSAPQVQSAD